jgi:hypothetical protein
VPDRAKAAAKLVVGLQQSDPVPELGEPDSDRDAGEPAADHHDAGAAIGSWAADIAAG